MEARNERERYIANPLRLLRCAVNLGRLSLVALPRDETLRYTPEKYPMNWVVEAPVAEEDMLMQQD